MNNSILEAIYTRRSVRSFTSDKLEDEALLEIIKAGSFAPSGLNNQPWRFIIIKDEEIKKNISALTHYSKIVLNGKALIAVMLDTEAVYNREKDIQAIGACIQNMLLAIHSLGLGGVWLGEILNRKDKFNALVGIENRYELMAVIALGKRSGSKLSFSRKNIDELILKKI